MEIVIHESDLKVFDNTNNFMSNQMLFRGKSIDTEKWVEGYGMAMFDGMAVIIHKQGMNAMQHTSVYPESVGRVTGLYDKYKAEIWEGDILAFGELKSRYLVRFDKASFCIYHTKQLDWDGKPMKWGILSRTLDYDIMDAFGLPNVIGNNIDNPELISNG